jgi:hypothetical protein
MSRDRLKKFEDGTCYVETSSGGQMHLKDYFKSLHYCSDWNNGQNANAILSRHTISDMKLFAMGYVQWYEAGNGSRAIPMVRANIGFAIRDCSLWYKLKWWIAFRIRKSKMSYC